MRVQTFAISLLLSTPWLGYSAASSAPAPAAAAPPAPVRPVQPAPAPPAGGASTAPGTPSAPGQLPPGNQQKPSGSAFDGNNNGAVVPKFSAQTNAFAPNGQPVSTNGLASQLAPTNAFGSASNQFGAGFNNQFGGFSNQFGAFGNQFRGSNMFGGSFSNQFGTNMVLEDGALTPQDRTLVTQIRKELLPVIRRDRLPIHLTSQNGVVTVTGVVLSAQEAQQLVAIVQQTPGVTTVNNQLRVNPNFLGRSEFDWDHDRDDEAFSPADRDMLRDMRGRMRHHHGEPGASESVRIIAWNGVITLTGFVGSAAEAQALVAAAQSTPGVVRVDNDLQVRGQTGQGTSQTPATGVGGATGPSGVSTGADSSSGAISFPVPQSKFGGALTNTSNPPR